MEVFKKSNKSICSKCSNLENQCSFLGGKLCGTDLNIGYAFVEKCTWFNKNIGSEKQVSHTVKVAHKSESRIDMMGGGH